MRRLLVSIACGSVLTGCFSEPATPGGGGDSTGGPECTAGSLACPCGPKEACADGLACEASVSLCIDPMCTTGAMLCTCIDGACLTGLSCLDGLCRTPPAGDTTSSPGDGVGPTTDPLDDGATTIPGGSTGIDPTADTGVSTSTSTDPTGGGSACSELACVECFNCTTANDGDACFDADKACDLNASCASLRSCTKSCAGDIDCVKNTCCGNLGWVAGHEEFDNLAACVAGHCSCLADISCGS